MAKKEELSNEIKKNIDNYSQQIVTIKDFVTAVRMLPGMYIGALQKRGFKNCFREIFQNAVDQLIDPKTACNKIYAYFNEKTLEVIIEDFGGLGIPFDDMIRVLTTQHTGKNYNKKKGDYQSGLNGCGAKIVNALSEEFIVESYRYDGTARRIVMNEGYPTTKEPVSIPNKEKKQGTKVIFHINREIMGDFDISYKELYKLAKQIMSLTPLGSILEFEAVDYKGIEHKETVINKDGILTDLIMKMKKPIIKPIIISNDIGDKRINVAFSWDSEGLGPELGPDPIENVTSFCNFCPTTQGGGTHVDGFLKGVNQWFSDYMNKIYLSNQKAKDKLKVTPADIKTGLSAFLAGDHINAIFTGQAKEFLSNEDMEPFVTTTVKQGLDDWSKNNPNDLNKICSYLKNLAIIRQKADKDKVKMVTKYNASSLTGLPEKYKRPTGKDNLELIICEGDSAAGAVKNGRDVKCQGVFPVRGKVPNAFQKSQKELFGNAEVQGITKILLGTNYKRDFDPYKDCKWEKIIFMGDADVDGGHICSLLLRLFILYFPQLIEAGKVYKSIPPLFGIEQGKKTQYFVDRVDMVKYLQKSFSSKYTITDKSGKVLSNKELTILLAKNIDYQYEVDCIANRYAVDPCLLELVLVNHMNGKNHASLKKTIQSNYRFMDITERKGTMIVEGLAGSSYDTLFLNDKLISESKEIINLINDNDDIYYKMNGVDSSLYQIMKTFDELSPTNIQRYKGLGEMNFKKLAESALLPTGDRTLQRYTIEDIKEEIDIIRTYESDKKLLLAEIDKVSRTDLMGL